MIDLYHIVLFTIPIILMIPVIYILYLFLRWSTYDDDSDNDNGGGNDKKVYPPDSGEFSEEILVKYK